MKHYSGIILLGVLNLLHGLMHVIQFIQSLFIASNSFNGHKDDWFHHFMESPIIGFISVFIAGFTIFVGIRDYKHHIKHHD